MYIYIYVLDIIPMDSNREGEREMFGLHGVLEIMSMDSGRERKRERERFWVYTGIRDHLHGLPQRETHRQKNTEISITYLAERPQSLVTAPMM